jgi:predicted transglutaminase-like cysteine proteinase
MKWLLLAGLLIDPKWVDTLDRIASDQVMIDQCVKENICSREAKEFARLMAIAEGESDHARIGKINAEINASICRDTDLRVWHVEDFWASPLATIHAGRGDCDDIAILKLVVFRNIGIASSRMRLAVVKNHNEQHAVVLIFFDGGWFMLNSTTNTIVPLNLVTYYTFITEFELDSPAAVDLVVP